jgi:hypothetical protein
LVPRVGLRDLTPIATIAPAARLALLCLTQVCTSIGLAIGLTTGPALAAPIDPALPERSTERPNSPDRAGVRSQDRQSELWWTKEQIESELRSSKLISRWALSTDSPNPLASSLTSPLTSPSAPGPATLDVTINSQVWSLLDYFGRYEFANTLGIKAHELGYGLRIMSDRGLLLGQYRCVTIAPPSQCRVQLDSVGQRGSRNRSLF